MGTDQQFCLRWNDFYANITSAFQSLRDDEDSVNITLACDGKQIKAHKMVLSACSPYFRSLLKGNPCQHPIVFFKDVSFSNLSSILDFMYHGEVNVSHKELNTFLKTAEALKVKGIAEDEKNKDSEKQKEPSSPPPTKDPPDPASPQPEEGSSDPDTHQDSPPPKRQRRRSRSSVTLNEDLWETVVSDQLPLAEVDIDIKEEPIAFEEENMSGHQNEDEQDEDQNSGPSLSGSQAVMQQLQDQGFLLHDDMDMAKHPLYDSKVKWTYEMTLLLLSSLDDYKEDLSIPARKKAALINVHHIFLKHNYEVDFHEISRKYNNMIRTYRRIREKIDSGKKEKLISWPYYAKMFELHSSADAKKMPKNAPSPSPSSSVQVKAEPTDQQTMETPLPVLSSSSAVASPSTSVSEALTQLTQIPQTQFLNQPSSSLPSGTVPSTPFTLIAIPTPTSLPSALPLGAIPTPGGIPTPKVKAENIDKKENFKQFCDLFTTSNSEVNANNKELLLKVTSIDESLKCIANSLSSLVDMKKKKLA